MTYDPYYYWNKIDKMFAENREDGGSPIRVAEQKPENVIIKYKKPDPVWQKRIDEAWWSSKQISRSSEHEIEKKIWNRLICFGGNEVCLPVHEDDADALLERGQFWTSSNICFEKMDPEKCHSNAAQVWKASNKWTLENSHKKKIALATGYALSGDGVWRQHSWCVVRTPGKVRILETTEPRIVYYGFVMTDLEAEEFCNQNL